MHSRQPPIIPRRIIAFATWIRRATSQSARLCGRRGGRIRLGEGRMVANAKKLKVGQDGESREHPRLATRSDSPLRGSALARQQLGCGIGYHFVLLESVPCSTHSCFAWILCDFKNSSYVALGR